MYELVVMVGFVVSFAMLWIFTTQIGKCKGDKKAKKPLWIALSCVGFAFLVTFSILGLQINSIMQMAEV